MIPIAIGVAILKYHLYDIDLVLRKTLVFGVLAVFITLVYVAIVVGVGTAVGSSGNPVLRGSRRRSWRWRSSPSGAGVNASPTGSSTGSGQRPYEVLSEFSSRLGEAYDPDDVLPRMARILADGTGSKRADVWLHVGGRAPDRGQSGPSPTNPRTSSRPSRSRPGSFPCGIAMSSSVRCQRPEGTADEPLHGERSRSSSTTSPRKPGSSFATSR